jgi:hypothetical protein
LEEKKFIVIQMIWKYFMKNLNLSRNLEARVNFNKLKMVWEQMEKARNQKCYWRKAGSLL